MAKGSLKKSTIKLNYRYKTMLLSIVIVSIIIIIYTAGLIINEKDVAPNFNHMNLSPSFEHVFGTDWLGRDLFFRTLKGLSISITVGIISSSLGAVIATLVGIVAAMSPKYMDHFINWIINLVMGVPHMILLILISFACGKGMKGLLIGIVLTHWTNLARLIRGEVIQLRSSEYIAISSKLGRSKSWILVKHMIPHIMPQLIIGMVLIFPHAILHEASLSFLGYGLQPEEPAIGIILSESMRYLSTGYWWLSVFPGITMGLIVLLIDKLGDNLKILIDPYSAQE